MKDETASLRESWESEVQAAWLYRVLAATETGERKRLFEALAADALEQSRAWVKALEEAGAPAPEAWEPGFRVRLAAALVRRVGPRSMLPALAALKVRGLSVYRSAPSPLEALASRDSEAPGARPGHHLHGEEQRHLYTRGVVALRAGVFGVNDGLVSNAALILGVGYGSMDPGLGLAAGAVGLLAGSLSMGAGEYLSVRSQIELYEKQIALEEEELRLYPEDEAEELALIFEARGLPREQARELGHRLIGDPARALDVLTREELGLNPDELGSPWAAGAASFLSFAAGAALPLLPFAVLPASPALAGAGVLAVAALFGSGAAASLFTGRNGWWSGTRLAAIGAAAVALVAGASRFVGAVFFP